MAEAVFAGEEVKKFSSGNGGPFFRATDAIFPRLAKNFFVSDGPCNARNGDGKHKKPDDLSLKVHNYRTEKQVPEKFAVHGSQFTVYTRQASERNA
jgi:hypothetical protein